MLSENRGFRVLRHLGDKTTLKKATLALKWVRGRDTHYYLQVRQSNKIMQNKNTTHSREVTIAYVFCSHLSLRVIANCTQTYGPDRNRYISSGG